MPIWNQRSGMWCSGVAGSGVYVGRAQGDGRQVWTEAGDVRWLDDRTIIAQRFENKDARLAAYDVVDGTDGPVLIRAPILRIQASQHGHWAALVQAVGVRDWQGRKHDGADLGAMGPDGSYAIKVDYFSAGPWDVIESDGRRWRLTDGDCFQQRAYGTGRFSWVDERGTPQAIGLPAPTTVGRPTNGLQYVEIAGQWWLLYQIEPAAGGKPVVLHPVGREEGYVVSDGDAYGLDARVRGTSVDVIYATRAGEGPSEIRIVTVDTTRPRLRLVTKIVPEGPPVPPPPVPPVPPAPPPQPPGGSVPPAFIQVDSSFAEHAHRVWAELRVVERIAALGPFASREQRGAIASDALFAAVAEWYHDAGQTDYRLYKKGFGGTNHHGYAEDIVGVAAHGTVYWADVGVAFGGPSPSLNLGQLVPTLPEDLHKYEPPPREFRRQAGPWPEPRPTPPPPPPSSPPPAPGPPVPSQLEARVAALERLVRELQKPSTAAPTLVALRTAHGTVLCAEDDGRVTQRNNPIGSWETFEVIPQ